MFTNPQNKNGLAVPKLPVAATPVILTTCRIVTCPTAPLAATPVTITARATDVVIEPKAPLAATPVKTTLLSVLGSALNGVSANAELPNIAYVVEKRINAAAVEFAGMMIKSVPATTVCAVKVCTEIALLLCVELYKRTVSNDVESVTVV